MNKQQGTRTSSEVEKNKAVDVTIGTEVEKNKAVDVTIGTAVSYEDLLKAVAFQKPLKKDPGKDIPGRGKVSIKGLIKDISSAETLVARALG